MKESFIHVGTATEISVSFKITMTSVELARGIIAMKMIEI
jgi:hypothetical protein